MRGAAKHPACGPPRGVLPAPHADRRAPPPDRVLRGRAQPEIFDILGTYTRVDDEEIPFDPRGLRDYEAFLDWVREARHDAERGVRRQGHVGLLQRFRRPAARRRRNAVIETPRRARPRVPRPALRLGDARGQGRPGDLAVEGDPDLDVAARRRRRTAARPRAALQLRRHRPPRQAAGARRGRVAPVLRPRRRRAPTRSSTSSSSSGYEQTALGHPGVPGRRVPAPATPSASGGCGGRPTSCPATGRSGTGPRRSAGARPRPAAGCRISRLARVGGVTPPNIVYLHSHDTGRFVQPLRATASRRRGIQGLAEQGVLFRQAFCAAPTCSASRACLLTGQYAHTNGMLGLAHRGWSLNDYSHHIVHTPARRRLPLGADRRAAHLEAAGRDRLRPRCQDRHAPRRRRRAGDDRHPPRPAAASRSSSRSGSSRRTASSSSRCRGDEFYVKPPPNLPGHARDAAGHGVVRRQRALARPRRGRGARRARALRPCRQHARHLHDRPRHRVPRRQGDDDRPRARRDADHARAGRVRGRQGVRRAGLAHRHLPDDLRPGRDPQAGLAAGPVADADHHRRDRRDPRRRLRGGAPTTRRTSPSGRSARRAGSTSAGSTPRRGPVLPNTDDSPSKDLGCATAGRRTSRDRAAVRPRARSQRGVQPDRRPAPARDARTSCASASSAGWRGTATRCWTARSRRRRAPWSTTPTASRRSSRRRSSH